MWRLQLTLTEAATQKQMAVFDLNGTSFGQYWKPNEDTVSIRGSKDDKIWLGAVIATGMAVAKIERKRFKSQLGSEEFNCQDQRLEPERFSTDLHRDPSLKSTLSAGRSGFVNMTFSA